MQLRIPCRFCGSDEGHIRVSGGQDCVICCGCERWQINAPKTETGRAARSLRTTHELIKPSLRWKIIERAGGVCESCKRSPAGSEGLQVGHVVSVEDGHKYGLTDRQINSEENLIAQCAECNSGASSRTIPIWMLIAIVKARMNVG
jgi:5-methylcytosine-specific restriction endonuclease McrA